MVIGVNATSDDGVVSIDRGQGEPDDVPGGAGDVTGADEIATTFRASNGSSEVSDYFVAALMRDGIRIGTAFTSIENVRPGESASGDGFSLVDGPDVGVSCEVVRVSRTSSE